MFRTPAKKTATSPGVGESPRSTEKAGSSPPSVRRSIGEGETGNTDPNAKSLVISGCDATPPKTTTSRVPAAIIKLPKRSGYPNLTSEARACLNKAKLHLGNSRNLKAEIKTEVLSAIDRLYELVKESERSKVLVAAAPAVTPAAAPIIEECPQPRLSESNACQTEMVKILEKHSSLIKENMEQMEKLSDALSNRHIAEEQTFAGVVAARNCQTGGQALERATLHSVVVSSKEDFDTGEEVLEKIRKAVDAKEGWVQVERVRKAKDRKIIMGCATKEERRKIKERLEAVGENLVVEEVVNRDPLLILRDVLLVHSDEEILKALRNQNREVFHDIGDEAARIKIRYRKKTRNPHVSHVVLSVSPTIWRRAIEGGKLRIDLQRVRVEDQTPLVQCTRCLGFGHGKRFCKEAADLCSHCGGLHLRADCPDIQLGEAARCINCTKAKTGNHDHNAFSNECPVRRKWDALARASVAYC